MTTSCYLCADISDADLMVVATVINHPQPYTQEAREIKMCCHCARRIALAYREWAKAVMN